MEQDDVEGNKLSNDLSIYDVKNSRIKDNEATEIDFTSSTSDTSVVVESNTGACCPLPVRVLIPQTELTLLPRSRSRQS